MCGGRRVGVGGPQHQTVWPADPFSSNNQKTGVNDVALVNRF